MNRAASITAGLAATLMATACATSAPPSGTADGTDAAERPFAGSELVGTYTRVVGAVDEWTLEITEEGAAFINPSGGRLARPVTAVSDTEITFAADPDCLEQTSEPTEGRYEWELEDGTLTFTEIEDSCDGRAELLTEGPWEESE